MPIAPDIERLLDATARELVLRRYSPRTRKVYVGHIRRFIESSGVHPRDATEDDVREFLVSALGERASVGYQCQAIAALRFLFQRVMKRPAPMRSIPLPTRGLFGIVTRKRVRRPS